MSHNPPPAFATRPVEEYAEQLAACVCRSKFLYDNVITCFLQHDIWASVPAEWHSALEAATFSELITLTPQDSYPLSLITFLQDCHDLAMPRAPIQLLTTSVHPEISRGMSEKKEHECSILAPLVAATCSAHDVVNIVDVGAGLGYLGNVLKFHFSINSLNIEGNPSQHARSTTRAQKIEGKLARMHESQPTDLQIPSVNFFLTHESNPIDLEQCMRSSEESASMLGSSLGVVGLHACGDLSVFILKLFSAWKSAKALVNIGCCYHKVQRAASLAFPMSRVVRSVIGKLGDNETQRLLELATNAGTYWSEFDEESLKIRINQLLFRSVLDLLFIRHVPDAQRFVFHVKKIKSRNNFKHGFREYLNTAVDRVFVRKSSSEEQAPAVIAAEAFENWAIIKENILSDPTVSSLEARYSAVEIRMAAYLALQTALAPVAESLVILDRHLYLKENGIDSKVLSIFDPKISPRNLVIVANK